MKGCWIEIVLMKGMMLCGKNVVEDVVNCVFLDSDEKNCVENLMIVDLLWNDLLWVLKIGLVKVLKLFDVEIYVMVY